jgi:hypothetical protein
VLWGLHNAPTARHDGQADDAQPQAARSGDATMRRRTFLTGLGGSVVSPSVFSGCQKIPNIREKSARIENGRTTKQDIRDLFGAPYTQLQDDWRTSDTFAPRPQLPAETVELWRYRFPGSSKREDTYLAIGFDASGKVTAHKLDENVREAADPCFVATVVYGSGQCREVAVLRTFRDHVLLRTSVGCLLVRWYYRFGPRAAVILRARPVLRRIVKVPLDLLVHFSP